MRAMKPNIEIMTVEDLSKYLQLHVMTIYKRVKDKSIPHYRIGTAIRFRKEQVDKWMEKSLSS